MFWTWLLRVVEGARNMPFAFFLHFFPGLHIVGHPFSETQRTLFFGEDVPAREDAHRPGGEPGAVPRGQLSQPGLPVPAEGQVQNGRLPFAEMNMF